MEEAGEKAESMSFEYSPVRSCRRIIRKSKLGIPRFILTAGDHDIALKTPGLYAIFPIINCGGNSTAYWTFKFTWASLIL
ncbi:MAG TPA: hypothetical protein VHR42_10850 [Clostridia bacterium]|nr:hypothetical protein [Clostridia bacterium]